MALTPTEEALVRQLLDQQAAILSLAENESTITSKLGATKVTLADLLAASSVGDTDLFLTRQGVTDKSVTAQVLRLGLAGFTQIGTGAVTRTLQDKSREAVSPLDYMTEVQKADVYAGTQTVDVSDAFNKASAAARTIVVPGYKYLVNDEVAVQDNQTWIFEGADLKHTDDTKHILRANAKQGWNILGQVTLRGTLTVAATAAEKGLYITGGKKYRVEGVVARNFKGIGIHLDGSNPSGLRGDRGQFTDCSTFDCTVGRQVDAGAEYTTWTNFNSSGCITGDEQAGGNVVTIGGNIVDNSRGVHVVAGANHLHGMHVGVNINHNTSYNIETTNVTNGHDFIGCHIYGNGSGSGAIFFDNSKGICIRGGHLDCWIYNYSGASSGYNYITDMYCPGSYGDIERLDAAALVPQELIIKRCDGPGAYKAGVSINDPGDTYVHAIHFHNDPPQALAGLTALIFPQEQQNGDRRRAFNTTTGVFTCPANQSGQYRITGQLYFEATAIAITNSYVQIEPSNAADGNRLALLDQFSTNKAVCNFAFDMYINAGETLTIKASVGGTSPTFGGNGYTSTLTIERIA